jgi:hypothetical protein
MKECNRRKSHIRSKFHMIYIFCNNGRLPVTKTFTTLRYTSPNYTSLHYTCWHYTSSHLNFTQLHFTLLHLLTLLPLIKTLPNYTSLHYTCWHCTSSHLNFTQLHFTSLRLLTLHFLSFKLHPSTLHYPLIWLNSILISYRSISPHIIFTSNFRF